MQVPLIQVTIRRDANTITPITVPAYERTLLRNMFGAENVQGDDVIGAYEADPAGEYERLCAKYGTNKVIKVFGDDGGERLQELVEKAAAGEAKPAKGKAKKADDAESAE